MFDFSNTALGYNYATTMSAFDALAQFQDTSSTGSLFSVAIMPPMINIAPSSVTLYSAPKSDLRLELYNSFNEAPTFGGFEDINIATTVNGDSTDDAFGRSVAIAGDVNGDGFDDIIIGATGDDNAGTDSGSARVISGADGSVLYDFDGDDAVDTFGISVAGVGDINGDGFDDLIIGAIRDSNGDAFYDGSARVVSGQDGATLYTLTGDADYDFFGASVAGAGDVNGDGFDDFIVGAPGEYGTSPSEGFARVFSGVDGSVLYTFSGVTATDQFGGAVAGAGDVNGDGFDDLIVGAVYASPNNSYDGAATVFSGADGSILYTFNGNSIFDRFGTSVDSAGDVNGDGFDDVIVGAVGDAVNGTASGSATVFSGADGSILYNINGDDADDFFGISVSGAGDVNGDGFDDFIVGALNDDNNGANSGSATIFSGADGSIIAQFNGEGAGDQFGRSVSGGGDINGDGFGDVVIGSTTDDNNGTDTGSARIIVTAGSNNTVDAAPDYTQGEDPVILDADVRIDDVELDALNGGAGDYNGASFSIARVGGANAADVFAFALMGDVTVSGGDLLSNGDVIGSFTVVDGALDIAFTSANGTTVTRALVNQIMSAVTYENIAATPDNTVTLSYVFSDGNTSAQGTGGALTATSSLTVDIFAAPSIPGVTLTGDETNNTLIGDVNDDTLNGLGGNDTLIGSAGNDALNGGAGDDILNGGVGGDVIDGGDGVDTVDFRDSSAGVSVDLLAGTASGGDADGDTITNVERAFGSSFGDTLTGDSGDNLFIGLAGDDVLSGQDGDDYLIGDAGNDTLNGGNGDDVLRGGTGADVLSGGEGHDIADYRASDAGVIVDLLAGTGADGDAEGDSLSGIEDVFGSAQSDAISGDNQDNTLLGFDGDDTLFGRGGNDVLVGGAGADTLNGGDGDDVLRGGTGADSLQGGDGVDVIDYRGSTAGVSVDLLAGTASGGDADGDTMTGIERVFGSELDDALTGDQMDNMLIGFAGNDDLNGLTGNDYLIGDAGDDSLNGGDGNDVLRGGTGADVLSGGDGNDIADYRFSEAGVNVDLLAGTGTGGDAQGDTLSGIEQVFASAFDDTLTGDAQDNTLLGFAGNDTLNGGGGNDFLIGGDGDDTLNGDAGNDVLRGGAGADVLSGGDGVDVIDYRDSSAGVTVDLLAGTASGGDAQGDTISNIERVIGSQLDDSLSGDQSDNMLIGLDGNDVLTGLGGNDYLIGDAGNDTLSGGDGNDVLRGGQGADVLDGGDGNDIVDYRFSQSGVNVDLLAGTGTGGDAQGDTLTAIEQVYGSGFVDMLTGDAQNNVLLGFAGDDVLNGGAGNDWLLGGAGADTFIFNTGSGDDRVFDFEAGVDMIDLTAFGFSNFADVQAAMTQDTGFTLITLSGDDSIRLDGIDVADLSAADFGF